MVPAAVREVEGAGWRQNWCCLEGGSWHACKLFYKNVINTTIFAKIPQITEDRIK